jgi:hypothetical protein
LDEDEIRRASNRARSAGCGGKGITPMMGRSATAPAEPVLRPPGGNRD